jgi:hypothetical protein
VAAGFLSECFAADVFVVFWVFWDALLGDALAGIFRDPFSVGLLRLILPLAFRADLDFGSHNVIIAIPWCTALIREESCGRPGRQPPARPGEASAAKKEPAGPSGIN